MGPRKNNPARRGSSLVYISILITFLMAMASMGVDYGRVRLAKSELQTAADAAAMGAAPLLGNYAAVQTAAVDVARRNACDGVAVVVDPNLDVEFVTWDSTKRSYEPVTGGARDKANAVKVWCRRTADRQTAIPLTFARMLGREWCDVSASAIAVYSPSGFGLVGLDYIKLKGNSTASYGGSGQDGKAGHIASNGPISSAGSSVVSGTVWHLASQPVTGISATDIRTMGSPLKYADGSSGTVSKNNNDNGRITPSSAVINGGPDFYLGANKNATLPAGSYWFRDVTAVSGSMINCTGPVTIYYYGTFSMNAQVTTYGSDSKNLKIVGVPNRGNTPGPLSLGGGSALYASIYAPQSAITLNGTGAIYGWIIGKSVEMTGSSDIYYDLSNPNSKGGAASVTLVR